MDPRAARTPGYPNTHALEYALCLPSTFNTYYAACMDRSRTDAETIAELGRRFREYRLQQNVSQAALAHRAGLSVRTLQNLEAGRDSQLSTVLRALRALGRLDAIDSFLPVPRVSPMTLLETQGRGRQRAGGPRRG